MRGNAKIFKSYKDALYMCIFIVMLMKSYDFGYRLVERALQRSEYLFNKGQK